MELTSPGSAVGTVAYMSPEQAKGIPLDARTDLFSLGTVIYEMATGKTPFAGESTAEVFAALLKENPPPVSTVNPAMPKKLDAIVEKLLRKDPAQRYATAEQLREDLESLDAPATRPAEKAAAGKWPWVAAAVVLLLIVAGLAWWKLKPARTTANGGAAMATGVGAQPQARRRS